MSKFANGVKAVGHDALAVVESPVSVAKYLGRAAKVLEDAIEAEPEVKTVLASIVSQSTAIAAATGEDVASKGLNVVEDLATLMLLKNFAVYVETTVVPLVAKLYGKVKADTTA